MNDNTPSSHDTPDEARQAATTNDMSGHVATGRDRPRQAAASPDMSRQAATDRDLSDYTMTVEEALTRFDQAGVKRDKRTIERYCEHSKIDAVKVFGEFGPVWRLNPESVEGKIKNLLKFSEQFAERQAATTPDTVVRQAATQPATSDDMSRHVAASRDMSGPVAPIETPVSPVVAPPNKEVILEEENSRLKKEFAEVKQENLDLKVSNRGLTKTVGTLSEEISAFGKERREMQAERKSFMAQIGELTTRMFQLQGGRERQQPEPIKAEIVQEKIVDVEPPPSEQSGEQKVDNAASENIV